MGGSLKLSPLSPVDLLTLTMLPRELPSFYGGTSTTPKFCMFQKRGLLRSDVREATGGAKACVTSSQEIAAGSPFSKSSLHEDHIMGMANADIQTSWSREAYASLLH